MHRKSEIKKMTDFDIRECYPNPLFFECESIARIADIIIGGVLVFPILFFTAQFVKQFFETGDKSMRNICSFFVLTSFSFTALITNSLIGTEASVHSNSDYFYQAFPRYLYCLSNCVLAEKTAIVLCLVKVFGAKIIKWSLIFVRYAFIIMSIVSAFLAFAKIDSEMNFNYNLKFDFYKKYVNPIMSVGFLILHALFVIVTTIAFVFIPRISDLFDKKFIKSMKILLFVLSFFFLIWYIFFEYMRGTVNFNRIIIIRYGLDNGIISMSIFNIFAEYIPKTLFASAMWFLSRTPKGTEESEKEDHKEITLSLSLNDNEDDMYLFPN
jgi:hypothetical protein